MSGPRVTVSVSGLQELEARLNELTQSGGKGVLRRVGRQALVPFDERWRQLAPHLYGSLERSGSVGSKLTRSQRKARIRESSIEVFAGPGPNPQAVQQEFGNVNSPAQPFVRPAWDATRDEALDLVRERLGVEIDKAARRQARKRAKAAAADTE